MGCTVPTVPGDCSTAAAFVSGRTGTHVAEGSGKPACALWLPPSSGWGSARLTFTLLLGLWWLGVALQLLVVINPKIPGWFWWEGTLTPSSPTPCQGHLPLARIVLRSKPFWDSVPLSNQMQGVGVAYTPCADDPSVAVWSLLLLEIRIRNCKFSCEGKCLLTVNTRWVTH